jgi:hypothetical protein
MMIMELVIIATKKLSIHRNHVIEVDPTIALRNMLTIPYI